MKKGKRVKINFPIEYRLLLTPKYDEHTQKKVTRLALRTVTEFSSFRYEILVDESLVDKTLRLNIHGLRAPRMTLPAMGPATFEKEYPDLTGRYTLVVSKLEREETSFVVHISEDRVTIEKAPQKTFVDVVTREEEW